MSTATESGSPAERLKDAAPLSRESLCDGEVVRAAWQYVTEERTATASALEVWHVVTDDELADGNIMLSDVMEALDYFVDDYGGPSGANRDMELRILRANQ